MVPRRVMEGTGEQVARYAKGDPSDRFELLLVTEGSTSEGEPKVISEGYADRQFNADIREASSAIDRLMADAIKEDERGATRKFPK